MYMILQSLYKDIATAWLECPTDVKEIVGSLAVLTQLLQAITSDSISSAMDGHQTCNLNSAHYQMPFM